MSMTHKVIRLVANSFRGCPRSGRMDFEDSAFASAEVEEGLGPGRPVRSAKWSGKAWARCAIGVALWLALAAAPAQGAAAQPTTTLLITHPRAAVLKHYVTLVRQHVLDVPNLRLVGIYHESE